LWDRDTFPKKLFANEDLSCTIQEIIPVQEIWSLSDVNEDGWLDLAEFCTAMHLIVLRVKGELPVPPILPPALKPPMTAPRTQSQVSSEGSRPSGESQTTSTTMQQNEGPDGRPNTFTRSEGNLSSQIEKEPPQFSDVPPLLVDSRPLPIKSTSDSAFTRCVVDVKKSTGTPTCSSIQTIESKSYEKISQSTASADLHLLATCQSLRIQFMRLQYPADLSMDPPSYPRWHMLGTPSRRNLHKNRFPETEHKWIDPSHVENFIKNFGSQFQELWDREERFESGRTRVMPRNGSDELQP
ncbi:unnamed protein product, partial [Mesorhabditis spiculigera]